MREARTDESKIYGFKEVWTNEFAHVLTDELTETKVIHVVRDPRSVFLSNLSSNTGAYPGIFLCRQWRKISSFALEHSRSSKNSFILRYEDLILYPKKTCERLCNFLGIDFSKSMLDPSQFVDGEGLVWSQNSSFDVGIMRQFNPKSVLWEAKLDQDYIRYVEVKVDAKWLS